MKSNGENNLRLRLRFKDYKREKIQMDVDKYLASGGKEQDKTYEDGRAARRMDVKRESCPFGTSKMQQRAFWLAGWHDMDMELESK